jgi:hypothetical protein
MKEIKVPENYKCPLCPHHKDDVFHQSKVVGAPICRGCSIDISILAEQDERPDDLLLDRLEELTGLSFHEYKSLVFEEVIEEYKRMLQAENIDRETKVQIKITGQSFDEVVANWRENIEYYQNELDKLNRKNRG